MPVTDCTLKSPPEAAVGPKGSGEEKATILVNLKSGQEGEHTAPSGRTL